MILTEELTRAQEDTQQRRQTLLVISVQRRCQQNREEGIHAKISPLLPLLGL